MHGAFDPLVHCAHKYPDGRRCRTLTEPEIGLCRDHRRGDPNHPAYRLHERRSRDDSSTPRKAQR